MPMRTYILAALALALYPPKPAASSDVSRGLSQQEETVEAQYAKLIQDARKSRGELEDKIKDLDQQVAALKAQAGKVEIIARKLNDLLPRFLGAVGSDSGAGKRVTRAMTTRDALAADLARARLPLSPEDLLRLADAITRGGQGAVALAVYVCVTIADADADRAHSRLQGRPGAFPPDASAARLALLARRGFPVVSAGDLASAAAMPGPSAASFFAARVDGQMKERLGGAGAAIEQAMKNRKSLSVQIGELGAEIEKLKKAKESSLAALRAKAGPPPVPSLRPAATPRPTPPGR